MIKAIIFDFFDVIRSDLYNLWLKNHGYVREGGFLDASQKLDSGEIDIRAFIEILSFLSGLPSEDIATEFETVGKIDHEVMETIKALKVNYKIGLLSNSESGLIRGILRENDLEKYFDEIVVSSEVGHIKPSKEIFDIMLERLSVEASEALFIDDNKYHTQGAERVGIKSITFESASQLKAELRKVGLNVG